jgi:hypothetical protein
MGFVMAIGALFFQSSNQYETIYIENPNMAKQALTENQVVTIGWRNKPFYAQIKYKDDQGLITIEGTKIPYKTISFITSRGRVSSPHDEWRDGDTISRLQGMFVEAEIVQIRLKVPASFVTTVKYKDANGFNSADGKRILYEDIGYITKRIPVYEAFPRTLLKYILIVPALLVWVFVEFLTVIFGP